MPPFDSTDRLPPLDESEWTPLQREVVAELARGPRGTLAGNWAPWLRVPELMRHVQRVGEYLRYHSDLDEDLIELVILHVARKWNNNFEYAYHHPIAVEKGLPAEVIVGLANGTRPTSSEPRILAIWVLLDELAQRGVVSDPVYNQAVTVLDERRVVEAIATAGYYAMLAMMMNVAGTPPPPGPRLPPTPRRQ